MEQAPVQSFNGRVSEGTHSSRPPKADRWPPVRRLGYVRRLIGVAGEESAPSATEIECEQLFEDDLSLGCSDMPGLAAALGQLRRGDTLVVLKLAHLGLSTKAILQNLELLDRKGIQLCSLYDGIEPGSGVANAVTKVGSILAETQRELKRERTRMGHKAASSAGRLRGARPSISPKLLKVVRHLMDDTDLTMNQIAESIGTSRNTLYRSLKRAAAETT